MMDLASLPTLGEKPETWEQAAQAENAEQTERSVEQIVPAVWNSITEEQKAVHLQTLIVACVDNIYRNNPVLWIWTPPGTTEEVTRSWVESMTRQLGENIDPSDPATQLYFPDVKEDANISVPVLYTHEAKVGSDLLAFTRDLATFAEVDLAALQAQAGLDIPSMRGLLLFWKVGMPAMMKIMQQEQEKAETGLRKSQGGIILPG